MLLIALDDSPTVDGEFNCVYDIFAATDEELAPIFPVGQDIALIDEVLTRGECC